MDRIADSIQRATEARQRASAAESTAADARQFGADLLAPAIRALCLSFAEFRRYDGTDDDRFLGMAMDVVAFVSDRWPSSQDVPETDGKGWARLAAQTDSPDIRIQAIRRAMSGAVAADGDVVAYTVADGMARQFASMCARDADVAMRYSSLFGFAPLAVSLRVSQRAAEEARKEAESAIAGALSVGAVLAGDGCLAYPGVTVGDALCVMVQEVERREAAADALPTFQAPGDADDVAAYPARRTEAIKSGASRIYIAGQESERRYMEAKRAQDASDGEYMARSDTYHAASVEVETAISEEMRSAYDAGFEAGAAEAFQREARATWQMCTDETLAILPDVAVAIGRAIAGDVAAMSVSLETMSHDGKVDQSIGAASVLAAMYVAGDADVHDAIYRGILEALSH